MTPRKQITAQRRAKQAAKKLSGGRKGSAKKSSVAKSTSPIVDVSRGSKPSLLFEPRLVQIEKPVYGGAFLARLEGKAVFVPLTLPGEQARVRMTQSKSGYATAEARGDLACIAGADSAPLSAFWRLRRLPLPAHQLRQPTGLQAGDSARNTPARWRACARRDHRTLRRTMGLQKSHPAGPGCGGKSRLSRPPLARRRSPQGMPRRSAIAGRGRAGLCRGCAPVCSGAAPHRTFALLRSKRDGTAGDGLY